MVYFGKGCKFFNGIWEDPDHNSNSPKEAKCYKKNNPKSECKFQYCPLKKPILLMLYIVIIAIQLFIAEL